MLHGVASGDGWAQPPGAGTGVRAGMAGAVVSAGRDGEAEERGCAPANNFNLAWPWHGVAVLFNSLMHPLWVPPSTPWEPGPPEAAGHLPPQQQPPSLSTAPSFDCPPQHRRRALAAQLPPLPPPPPLSPRRCCCCRRCCACAAACPPAGSCWRPCRLPRRSLACCCAAGLPLCCLAGCLHRCAPRPGDRWRQTAGSTWRHLHPAATSSSQQQPAAVSGGHQQRAGQALPLTPRHGQAGHGASPPPPPPP